MNSTKKLGKHIIKKYPNRRLYDTQTSSYITLVDIKQFVMAHDDFAVIDAKTGEDLTRNILLQIILEEEAGGSPMFSSVVLSQIIRFYGHAMQGMMGHYLEKNMQVFMDIQNTLAESAQEAAKMGRQTQFNPDMWSQLMSVQGPMMQGVMGNYIEQSKHIFTQMQEQIQSQMQTQMQNQSMFGFPFSMPSHFAANSANSNHSTPTDSAQSSASSAKDKTVDATAKTTPPQSNHKKVDSGKTERDEQKTK